MIHQRKENEKAQLKSNDQEHEADKGAALKSPPSQLFAAADAGSNKGNDRPVQQKSASSGMPSEVQEKMEGAFGQDFSDVKIHANSQQSTQMGALAHAQGNEIHFAPGQYNPSSQAGQELLGHELAHVVQQREGRVQANTSVGGAPVNNEQHLETEADQLGAKAAAGATQLKASSASKPGAQTKMGPIQRKVLANQADKDAFFKQYHDRAETVLAGWYKSVKTKDGRDQLTAEMFENAARKVYDAKGDTKFVVPIEFALAQAKLEGGVARNERLGNGNVFNYGAYDKGVSTTEKGVNTLEKGFDAYYKFMADSMLDDKSPEQLLEAGNFTTGTSKSTGVYATNPLYEGHIKGEIGNMNAKDAGFRLTGSVGIGGKNNAADVEKVGKLLAQVGYLAPEDATNAAKVSDAVLKFQKAEIAPTGEKWYQDRMKWVTNPKDQENLAIQLGWVTDGKAGNGGTTLGVLYYMAVMGGKVETAGGVGGASVVPTTPTVKPATPVVKPATPAANTTPAAPHTTAPTTTTAKPTEASNKSWWESTMETVSSAVSTGYDYVAGGVSNAYNTAKDWLTGSNSSTPAAKTPAPVTPAAKTVTPPAPPANNSISDSVGIKGKNNRADVLIIQALLVKAGYMPAVNSKGQTNIDGDCGSITEAAISKFQAEKAHLKEPDGRVDPNGTTWSALIGKPIAKPAPSANTSGGGTAAKTPTDAPKINVPAREATTGGSVFETIKNNNPNGITVSLYANYAKTGKASTDNNNAEFPRASGAFAKTYGSIGIDESGALKIGTAVPITSLADITSTLKGITDALAAQYKKENPNATEMPAFTKIHRLCLFSHGMPWGLHLSSETNGKWNLRIDSEAERKKFKAFVAGIRGTLKDDVVCDLFACHAGQESDGTEKGDVWHYDDAKKQDGSSSFAAALAEELGKDASVYGHLSAGHTVNNYSARVFGKDAGKDATKDKGGVHLFDILYPESFIKSEAARLKKPEVDVKEQMLRHYKKRMAESLEGKFSFTNSDNKKEKVELGAEMFADVNRAKSILQADWPTWLASNPMK